MVATEIQRTLGKKVDGMAVELGNLKTAISVSNQWRTDFVERCDDRHALIDTKTSNMDTFREVHLREHSYDKGLSARNAAKWALVGTIVSAPVTLTIFLFVFRFLGYQP